MGSAADVENEAKEALNSAKYPLILTPGCEVQSIKVPVENLRAIIFWQLQYWIKYNNFLE